MTNATVERRLHDTAAGSSSGAGSDKYLTFFLGQEEYGFEILKVQEIIGLLPITRVPRTPDFIRGVVNLRGKIIPVMDLRLKFGMETVDSTDETCIIVVEAEGVQIGVLVDSVSEVLDIRHDQVEAAPDFGTEVDTDYILGIGKAEDGVKLLLDIDRVFSAGELQGFRTLAASVSDTGAD